MVLFFHLTTRVPGDPDQDLLGKVGGRGFPTMVLMDSDGKVLAKQGPRSVAAFHATLTSTLEDRRLATEQGDDYTPDESLSPMEQFLAQLEAGRFTLEEAQRRYAEAPQDEVSRRLEQSRRAQAAFARLEAETIFREADAELEPGTGAADRARRIVAMHDAGRIPDGASAWQYWNHVMRGAAAAGRADLFDKALKKHREIRGDDTALQRFYRERRLQLDPPWCRGRARIW